MGDLTNFTGLSKIPLGPDTLLEEAKGTLSEVVIIGFTKDGANYFASSESDGGGVLWLLEDAKRRLLSTAERLSDGS